jgi:CPA2 family monovalent cation:H+ antiporter-2
MQVYSRWMASPGRKRSSSPQIRRLIRKWVLQIALNLALMAAIFIALAAVAKEFQSSLPHLPNWAGGSGTFMWLAALLLSLPLIVASVRKLRAMAMVLAEMSVPQSAAGAQTIAIRAAISNTIMGIGCTAIFVLVLLAGTPILPRGRVALVLITFVGIVAAIAWRWLVKVYAKAQISLEETLSAPQVSHDEVETHVPANQPLLPPALKEAELETVELAAQSPATGKLIRELQLRSLSGASAVAIERGQTNLVNPGPDEELTAGDRVLLLGSRTQLEAARKLLSGS